MEERFVIKRKDFKKLEKYAENIYNTAVVIDYFCSSQKEYEELYNLAPVFYDIIEMNRLGRSQNGRFELSKSQSGTKKEPLNKALNLNGGNDEARTRDLMRDRHAL